MELNKKTIRSITLGAMGCIVLYWVLHEPKLFMQVFGYFRELFSPFLVGICLAFILNVPMRAIEGLLRKHLHRTRGLAIVLTLACFLMVIIFVVHMLIPQITITIQTIADQLPAFLDRCEKSFLEFLADNPNVKTLLIKYTDFESWDWKSLLEQVWDFLGKSISTILSRTVSAIGNVFGAVWDLVISLIFSLYCLVNKENLARQLRRLLYAVLPENTADQIIRIGRLTNSTFSRFISGQCIEVCILGSMFAVTMTIFRMPYVSLVSVLVATTAFIPIVGAWTGCVLGAFFILVNDPMQAFWFVILFLVLQQIENNLIYPNVVGSSIGLPSMWVLCAVSIGGSLMGVAGMVLMIPLTSVIYTLLREFTASRVAARNIAPEKLVAHPPELKSRFRRKKPASPPENKSR